MSVSICNCPVAPYPFQSITATDKYNLCSLDSASDTHIQKLLRANFSTHTIIAVAHKLDAILDFDRVAVMHNGELVEIGEPYKLLEKGDSWFRALYEDGARAEEIDGMDSITEVWR